MPLDACFTKIIINDVNAWLLYLKVTMLIIIQNSTVSLNINYQLKKTIKGMQCKSTNVVSMPNFDLLGFLRCGLSNKSV